MGVPEDAHGSLGDPLTGIEIVFVQGGKEVVVARGSADGDYRFEALVTIPSSLQPGIARLDDRSGEHGSFARPTVSISTAQPIAAEGPEVRSFGQQTTSASRGTEPAKADADDADSSGASGRLIGGVLAGLVAAVAFLFLFRRRQE
ncbi:hypothetical protein [Nocardioides speluncae]|uniref:hypothetical protein n=1 Tax=Nocardioides speluncae TaxID=2670337 RepID=UPI00137B2A4B|nr:hypothetical protein [Nocardioides speluncae]